MPGAVARSSTLALTNYTLSYALKIANDPMASLKTDSSLLPGVNCWDGHCTYQSVAQDLNLPYTPVQEILR
jgi:alanine dehydrogenase